MHIKYIYVYTICILIYIYIYICIYIYTHTRKTTFNNTKAFVHILVNFFSCALTRFALKFKSEILAETPQTKSKEQKGCYKVLNC